MSNKSHSHSHPHIEQKEDADPRALPDDAKMPWESEQLLNQNRLDMFAAFALQALIHNGNFDKDGVDGTCQLAKDIAAKMVA